MEIGPDDLSGWEAAPPAARGAPELIRSFDTAEAAIAFLAQRGQALPARPTARAQHSAAALSESPRFSSIDASALVSSVARTTAAVARVPGGVLFAASICDLRPSTITLAALSCDCSSPISFRASSKSAALGACFS